jgi:phosphoribosylformylglycinamidine cyclo-ligase
MIVNDMATLGASPVSVAMHLAVGDSNWFNDEQRCQDLIDGWLNACHLARCTWGGGETPTLKDVIIPGTVVLSGSAMGTIKPKKRLITADKIQVGDAIVMIESSGIHANGLTMARHIGDRKDPLWRHLAHLLIPERFSLRALPQGYHTLLEDGRMFGASLLDPTHIYVGLVEDCLNQDIDIHYTVNITGHGWRKLMRAPQPFTYIIDRLPNQLPIFDFLQRHGPIDDREAYSNLNMGAGFALYVPQSDVEKVLAICRENNLFGFQAGYIEEPAQKESVDLNIRFLGRNCALPAPLEKKLVIRPKGLEFSGSALNIR